MTKRYQRMRGGSGYYVAGPFKNRSQAQRAGKRWRSGKKSYPRWGKHKKRYYLVVRTKKGGLRRR